MFFLFFLLWSYEKSIFYPIVLQQSNNCNIAELWSMCCNNVAVGTLWRFTLHRKTLRNLCFAVLVFVIVYCLYGSPVDFTSALIFLEFDSSFKQFQLEACQRFSKVHFNVCLKVKQEVKSSHNLLFSPAQPVILIYGCAPVIVGAVLSLVCCVDFLLS